MCEMIASPGKQLLQWAEDYIYPAEQAFADESHARAVASVFCDTLIHNGTTTACVYRAVYPLSVDALFEEALKPNLRLVARKCMMDRNVPEAIRDTAQSGYDQSKALIAKWHGRFVTKLFPERKDLLDVYEYYGLVGRRTVLGHCVWFSDSEFAHVHECDASTSNFFLGSGTSFSLLQP